MKVAIISDIHENFHNLAVFLKEVKKYDVIKMRESVSPRTKVRGLN